MSAAASTDRKVLAKRERVMRLDLERRALKEAARESAEAIASIDEHLAVVEQAKRDWLRRQNDLELQRKHVMGQEASARRGIDDTMRAETEQLVFVEWLPKLRRLKAVPGAVRAPVPSHRRK